MLPSYIKRARHAPPYHHTTPPHATQCQITLCRATPQRKTEQQSTTQQCTAPCSTTHHSTRHQSTRHDTTQHYNTGAILYYMTLRYATQHHSPSTAAIGQVSDASPRQVLRREFSQTPFEFPVLVWLVSYLYRIRNQQSDRQWSHLARAVGLLFAAYLFAKCFPGFLF